MLAQGETLGLMAAKRKRFVKGLREGLRTVLAWDGASAWPPALPFAGELFFGWFAGSQGFTLDPGFHPGLA